WIKAKEGEDLKIHRFSDADYLKDLEIAITYGQSFMIEGVEDGLDPIIDQVLNRDIQTGTGGRKFVILGDKEVDWDSNFRLYFVTKNPNPPFSPDVFGKVSVINYSVTRNGLEEQLLNVVVGKERADLETKRLELVSGMSENRAELKKLEDQLLRELANSEGELIDNAQLLIQLEETQKRVAEVGGALKTMRITAREIDQARNSFRSAAKRGAILFFAISMLCEIHTMYAYSLASYIEVFEQSLDTAPQDPEPHKRLHNIVVKLTECVFAYVCRSLFGRDKLLFAFWMAISIADGAGKLNKDLLNFFLKGNLSLDAPTEVNPCEEWINAASWSDITLLPSLAPQFSSLLSSLSSRREEWYEWAMGKNPELELSPLEIELKRKKIERDGVEEEKEEEAETHGEPTEQGEAGAEEEEKEEEEEEEEEDTDPFIFSALHKMCLVRCFRTDRVYGAVSKYIVNLIGEPYIHPPVLDYTDLCRSSTCKSPTLFILSPAEEEEKEEEEEEEEEDTDPFIFSALHKMCLVRCFRTDRVYGAVSKYIVNLIGEPYIHPPVLDYTDLCRSSTCKSPTLFILSPGADPATELQKVAENEGIPRSKLKFLALGQGQSPMAEQLLAQGSSRGYWVLLQNLHLLKKWLKSLDKLLEVVHSNPNPEFRVFLSTEPTADFPLSLLQRCVKVVTEPPEGLKLNMLASFSRLREEDLASCPSPVFRPVVYVLSFFHAVVQERRKYGKIGWNVSYDFNASDFRVSVDLIRTYLAKAYEAEDPLPWSSLRYLVGEAMYGGRVTDSFDRRILVTYLEEYFGDFLFDECQEFFLYKDETADGFSYQIPDAFSHAEYIESMDPMPQVSSPNVFGLHENADISFLADSARNMWAGLLAMQPREAEVAGKASREDIIVGIAKEMQQKMPDAFNMAIIKRKYPPAERTPAVTVLLQEVERYNILVIRMKDSLVDVIRALAGEIGLSAELDSLANSLFNGEIPKQWRSLAPQTEKKLASWINHLRERCLQYRHWILRGEPAVMWLSGLHIPESYLTALIQTACRKKKWALDRSTLFTKVTQITDHTTIRKKPEFGCYIRGLYLEGAGWDIEESMLRRQNPKELIVSLPVMQIVPIEMARLRLQNTLKTPVYLTQARRSAMGEGLVFEADLTTTEHKSHWILQGVCLVLNTKD
ncbi:Dynein axonemal heavy chain 10, partial [Aduncisulcus paluster]